MKRIAIASIALIACNLTDPQTVAADSYEAAQMKCVADYAIKADIDRCRAKVKLTWLVGDAGAEGGDR